MRTSIEERNRLFLGLTERHTSQSQHSEGMPVDVPDPRNRMFINFKGDAETTGSRQISFLRRRLFLIDLNIIEAHLRLVATLILNKDCPFCQDTLRELGFLNSVI